MLRRPPSAPTGIQHLALELLEEIVLYSSYQWKEVPDKATLCTLRLTCQQFKHAVDPVLFSGITFDFYERSLGDVVAYLQDLADGIHPACRLAKELHILHYGVDLTGAPCSGILISGKFGHLLMGAVKALRNVRSVFWGVHTTDGIYPLIDGLAEVPHFERLHLHFSLTNSDKLQPTRLIPLRRFPALRQLSIDGTCTLITLFDDFIQQLCTMQHATPSFIRLELAIRFISYDTKPRDYLHEIVQNLPKESPLKLQILRVSGWNLKLDSTTLPHLKFLSSLDICQMQKRADVPEVWDRLYGAGIHLEDIATQDASPQLVNYLKSYSGLKRFELRGGSLRRTRVGLAETYADIYRIVLPKHKDSLISLKLLDRRSIHACIDAEHIPPVSLCKRLSRLSVTVRTEGIEDINSMKQILINAIELPSLLTLEIDFSRTGPRFGGCCLNREHLRMVRERLEDIISSIDIQKDFPNGLPFREIIFQRNRYLPGIDTADSHRRFLKEPTGPSRLIIPFPP